MLGGSPGAGEELAARPEKNRRGEREFHPGAAGEVKGVSQGRNHVPCHRQEGNRNSEGKRYEKPGPVFPVLRLVYLRLGLQHLGFVGRLAACARFQHVVPHVAHHLLKGIRVGGLRVVFDRRARRREVHRRGDDARGCVQRLLDAPGAPGAVHPQQWELALVYRSRCGCRFRRVSGHLL